MFGKNILLNITFVAACTFFVAGCGNVASEDNNFKETALIPTEQVTASDVDKTLTLNLAINEAYCTKTACSCISNLATREYEELQEILKKKYNINLNLSYFIEEYELIDTLNSQQFDGVICKPWLAYMNTLENNIKFKRVADLLDINNNQWLTGIFIVKKDSPLKTVSEITGKILVAGQKDSYEKYHSPFLMMEKEKIVPSNIIQKASCLECINSLIDGEADAAIISDYSLTASCAVDVANPDDFRVIGKTEQIPLCSVILDISKIKEADALRFQKALLEISGEDVPVGLMSRGFVMPAKWIPVPNIAK